MADPLYKYVLAFALVLLTTDTSSAQQVTPAPLPAGPMTLEQVLELAQSRSEAIAIARTGVQRAEGGAGTRAQRPPAAAERISKLRSCARVGVLERLWQWRPRPPCPPFTLNPAAPLNDRVAEIERAIDCGAIGSSFFGGGTDDEEIDLPFGRENTWRVNLLFSQAVYSGGRLAAQADIAAAGRQSAELALSGARAQLLFDVTQAFYDAARSDRLVQIAEATVAQADATVRQVQSAFEAGAQPEFELLRARVTRDNQRPAVIRQRANRDIAILRLKQLLDLPGEYDLRLVAPLDGPVPPPPVFADRLAAFDAEAAALADAAARNAVREVAAFVDLREASLA